MVKSTNNGATKFQSIAMVISLLLTIAVVEGRSTLGIGGFQKAKSTIECGSVVGVNKGDTCAAIIQTFKLTAEAFAVINPNLNCDALFVGQWLCIED